MPRTREDVGAVNIRAPDEEEEDLEEGEEHVAAIGWPPEWPPGRLPGGLPEAAAAAQAEPAQAEPRERPRDAGKEAGDFEKQSAAKLVDMRGVAQPPPFTGDESAWQDWRFRFQTIMALLDMREVMQLAAIHPREITENELSEENSWKGKMLYSFLVALVSGRALGIVRQVPEGHGLESWRCLVRDYEPAVATRYWAVSGTVESGLDRCRRVHRAADGLGT